MSSTFPTLRKGVHYMGKNLKGKECGKGICQRKDGKYAARYTAKDGSRKEKHFDTLPEARNWLADAQYEDKHNVHNPSSEMTVDNWFEFWITNLIADLAPQYQKELQGTVSNEHTASHRKYAYVRCQTHAL